MSCNNGCINFGRLCNRRFGGCQNNSTIDPFCESGVVSGSPKIRVILASNPCKSDNNNKDEDYDKTENTFPNGQKYIPAKSLSKRHQSNQQFDIIVFEADIHLSNSESLTKGKTERKILLDRKEKLASLQKSKVIFSSCSDKLCDTIIKYENSSTSKLDENKELLRDEKKRSEYLQKKQKYFSDTCIYSEDFDIKAGIQDLKAIQMKKPVVRQARFDSKRAFMHPVDKYKLKCTKHQTDNATCIEIEKSIDSTSIEGTMRHSLCEQKNSTSKTIVEQKQFEAAEAITEFRPTRIPESTLICSKKSSVNFITKQGRVLVENSHGKETQRESQAKKDSLPQPLISNNSFRRRQEDNLAVIFMGIVLVFIISHLPRILLSMHETIVIKNAMLCASIGKKSFPLWALVFGYFSHLFLVLNSSGNCLIYCLLSSKFRLQAFQYIRTIAVGIR